MLPESHNADTYLRLRIREFWAWWDFHYTTPGRAHWKPVPDLEAAAS